jgi:hypothetical protein
VKEELPAILSSELQQDVAKELRASIADSMDTITKNMMDYLKSIEERQKDFQSYMIRQLTPPAPPVNKEIKTVKED